MQKQNFGFLGIQRRIGRETPGRWQRLYYRIQTRRVWTSDSAWCFRRNLVVSNGQKSSSQRLEHTRKPAAQSAAAVDWAGDLKIPMVCAAWQMSASVLARLSPKAGSSLPANSKEIGSWGRDHCDGA